MGNATHGKIDAPLSELITGSESVLTSDLYKNIIDHAHDAIYVLQNKRFTFVNPRFCELTGYTFEYLTDPEFDPQSILTDFARARTKQSIESRLAGDTDPQHYEIEFIRPDGRVVSGDLTSIMIFDHGVVTILGIIRDLSERKELERESQTRVRKLQDAIEAVADGVWSWDLKTGMVWINPANRLLLGFPSDVQLIQVEKIFERMHPDDRENTRSRVNDLIEGRVRFYTSEFRMVRDDGTVRWLLGRGRVTEYGEDGAALVIIGTNINITERKEAEIFLRDSEEKFARVFENAPLLMSISTLDEGRFLDVNSVFARAVGYQRDEIVGRTGKELGIYDKQDRERKIELLRDKGTVQNFEMKYHRSDGTAIFCQTFADRVEIDGKPYLLSIATDITAKKQEERDKEATYQLLKLMSEEAELKPMLEKVLPLLLEWSECEAVGIRIKEGDEFPFMVSAGYSDSFTNEENPLCVKLNNGEILRNPDGKPYYACICGNVIQARTDPSLENFTKYGSFWTSDLLNVKDTLLGKVKVYDIRSRCVNQGFRCSATIPLKTPKGVIGLLQFQDSDPSKMNLEKVEFLEQFAMHLSLSVMQKHDAQALKESETYYRHLVENATDSIFLINSNGIIIDVNQASCDSLGYSRDDLLGMEIGTINPSQPVEEFKRFWQERKHGEAVLFESIHCRKDGSIFPVEISGRLVEIHGEVHVVGAVRDISDRRRHEIERDRLQLAISQTGETIVITDPSGTITYVNPAFEKITGYTADEAVGRNPRVLKSGEHSREFYEELWKTISSGRTWKGRFVNKRKDGSHYVEDAVISPVMDQTGEIVNYIAIKRDITKQEEAASKLTHSYDLMTYVIEHTRSAIAVHDKDLNYVYVSQRYMEEYKIKENNIIGKHHYDVFPDIPEKWRKVHQRALLGEVSSAEDDPFPRADGSLDYTTWECRPWFEADGTVGGIIVYTEVTTEKRKAKEALRVSEERFRTLAYNIPGVVYLCNNDETYSMLFLNPEVEKLTGYPAEKFLSQHLSFVDLYHPEDAKKIVADVDAALEKKEAFHLIYRLRHKDGSYRWVEEYGVGVFKNTGELQFLEGFLTDITQQKREDNVLEAQMRLVEYANDATVHQLLQKFLDEAEDLTESTVGFYHFVDDDENQLTLQAWSSNTLSSMCTAEGEGAHYPVEEAGVWIDCIRERKPVIHNDYQALPHRKGMPEGHAKVIRELVVPVFRNRQIVAVLGVGNKETHYNQEDVAIIQRLADLAWETVTRKRSNEELQQSEERFRKVMASIRDLVFTLDKEQRHTAVYGSNIEAAGGDSEFFVGKTASEIFGDESGKVHREACDRALKGEFVVYDWSTRFKDKTWYYQTSLSPLMDSSGEVLGLVGVGRDVTDVVLANEEQTKLVNQLNQAQKMESVGRLAGGIAHDFNNLLGVILGYAELGIELIDESHASYNILQDIYKAAKKSSALTKQLLTFARKQTINQRVLNLNDTIEGTLRMLTRLVGEEIEITFELAPDLGLVMIDPTQVDQILANMAINARDAIDGVGTISISTSNILIDAPFAMQHPEANEGEYILLSFSDNGSGMDQETVSQIFEPFFTTKEAGHGTGLGLSTVYGIVRQNGGFITCYSEPGVGTTFRMYLPRNLDAGLVEEENMPTREAVQEGTETILLVEDEKSMLNLTTRILKKLGYVVLAATSPSEALHIAEKHAGRIELLMTDVIMPEMNGRDLSKTLQERFPQMKSLFMSGYTADIIAKHGVLEDDIHFLPKPFAVKDLAAKVRAALEQ